MVWPLFVCYFLHVCCLPCPFLSTGTAVWPLLQFSSCNVLLCLCMLHVHFCWQAQGFGHFFNSTPFFTILQFSTLGPLKLSRLSAKVHGRQSCQKPWVYDTFVQKNWTVSRGIATFIRLCPHFGHDSFWIAFVIEVVIAFVMPTFVQINFTIGSTTQLAPSLVVDG